MSNEAAFAGVVLPVYGGDFYADPYPVYRRLQGTGRPFYNAPEGSWLVAGYRDVAAALKDSRLSKRIPGESRSPLDASMLFQDPPDHPRLRALLSDGFTAPKVAEMERKVEAIADRLLQKISGGGRMEFIGDFATPLPAMVICELLGIGTGEYRELASLSHAMVTRTDENGLVTTESMQRIGQANAKLVDFFRRHLGRQESSRCPFHFPKLLGGGTSGDHEKIAAAILLLIAGHETTTNLLGNGLWLLIHHPEAWSELRADPALLDSAIEEMLRFESPVQRGTFRIASEDFELAGCHIKKGDQVAALIGAANRDPEIFPDPDSFDIRRDPNRHLAFGNGPHFCMGASLARLEARVAFRLLLERFAEVRIAPPQFKPSFFADLGRFFVGKKKDDHGKFPRWISSTMVRGLETLPVEFTEDHSSKRNHKAVRQMKGIQPPTGMDAIVEYYNGVILNPGMRAFFGGTLFYNVGLRNSGDEGQATASCRLVDLLLSWAPAPPSCALDVACGLGATTAVVKSKWPHCSVTGINISTRQIEHARANAPQCSFRQMDATTLHFPDETFDLVVCVEAAFHFDSRRDFLREAFRVLKKGGALLLADILFHDTPEAERTILWPVARTNAVEGMAGYLGILREYGFIIREHREGLDPCWKSFCASLGAWAERQHATGNLEASAFEEHFGPIKNLPQALDKLAGVVSSYPLVCAVKPG
jgi:cytochrome P450/ubiquinone/menaquinone biosynthesis C-methylase UbiE